ncbi:MAG: UDP-3-O-(3-hydroxymyristoyl)glucosamine N-acyltransferase [Dehalococcoidia bacterium]
MTKEMTITKFADMVKGRIVGSPAPDLKINGTCAVGNYVPGKVAFVRNAKYAEMLKQLQNAVVLIPESLVEFCSKYPRNVYLIVEDVVNSLMDTQDLFYEDEFIMTQQGISLTAKIDDSIVIGNQVYVGEYTCIGKNVVIGDGTKIMHHCCILDDVVIGSDTYIYPGVCVYKHCQIGNNCIIHSGVRIGVDGFRFEQNIERKTVRKLLHAGSVMIGNRVEIGSNCTVDRATFEDDTTILFDDVKLDDQVHIGHNAKVGCRTCIAAQTCISGSVKIGEDVWIGAGVSISDNVKIGDKAKVLLNAIVAYDVPQDEIVSGFYAMPHRQWKRVWQKLKEGL